MKATTWRVLVATNNGASHIGIYNLFFLDIDGSIITPIDGTVLKSSEVDSANKAEFAYITATATNNGWLASGSTNEYLGYSFPGLVDIYGVKIRGYGTNAPNSFKVQYDLGAGYVDFITPSAQTGWATGGEYRTFVSTPYTLAGNITESLAITRWVVGAYRCSDGKFMGSADTGEGGSSYSIPCSSTDPCNLICAPKINYKWEANRGVVNGDYTIATAPDSNPHIWKCSDSGLAFYLGGSLLLHADGANNSTTFTDSSLNAVTVTPSGTAKISTAQSKFGGSSMLFDGTGSCKISAPASGLFDVGAGDFTISCWVRPTSFSAWQYICGRSNSSGTTYCLALYIYTDGKLGFAADNSGGRWVNCATVLSINTWYHVEVCRVGNTIRVFLNGVQDGSFSITGAVADYSAGKFVIGNLGEYSDSGGHPCYGYIDEFLFLKGTGLHSNTFTPPTASYTGGTASSSVPATAKLLMHFDGANGATVFTDSSPTPKVVTYAGNAQISTTSPKFGTGSYLGDGSGDYLQCYHNDFLFTSGNNHTISFWFKAANNGTEYIILAQGDSSNYYQIIIGAGNLRVNVKAGGSSANDVAISHTLDANWHHFEWSKVGSTNTLYYDGTSIGSWTRNNWSFITSNGMNIGGNYILGGGSTWYGNIDELVLDTSVAYHTANFTPPTYAYGSEPVVEPTLATSGTTVDNNVTWTYVAPLIDPICLGPKIPS